MRPRPRVRSGAQSHESKQEILSSLWIEFSKISLRALKIYTRHTVSIMEPPKTVTPKYGFTPKFRKKIDLFRKKFGHPAGMQKINLKENFPGGFLFTMFPDQEPCVRDFTTRGDRRILS